MPQIVKFSAPAAFAILCVLMVDAAAQAADGKLDYSRDIRPLLADNCFACHGPDANKRQAGLRLDVREEALKPADSGVAAIVPDDAAKSELIKRIFATDDSERMPPADSTKKLTAEQKELLKRWVAEGAPYAQHWSFVPPQKAPLPEVKNNSWPKNEIDRFILARLEAEKFQPSPPADPRTILRRLSLDLTGLPPSAEELDRLVSPSPPPPLPLSQPEGESGREGEWGKTVEKYVDDLLASPHFGERLALDWLDAARYADTNGFSIDGGRHMWLWRDWVIQAFNDNTPYDQFLLEQIAGDLLPDATTAQKIASGFLRNNMVTHEGGTIPEENLTNYNVDRVKTLGEAVLGLTLACAQCHDHKYDPLTQKDFYQLFAYFNNVSDIGLDGNAGKNPRPLMMARTVLKAHDREEVEQQLASLTQQLSDVSEKDLIAWEHEQRKQLSLRGRDLKLHESEVLKVSTPNRGAGWDVEQNRYVHVTQPSDLIAYDVSLKLPETNAPITGFRVIFHPDSTAPGGGWGYGPSDGPARRNAKAKAKSKSDEADDKPEFKGNFVLTAFTASADAVPGDQVNLHRVLAVDYVTANTWQVTYPPENCLDPRNETGWSPALDSEGKLFLQQPAWTKPPFSSPNLLHMPLGAEIQYAMSRSTAHLTATLKEPIDPSKNPYATVQLNFGHGRSLVASRFEIQAMTGHDDDSILPHAVTTILHKPSPVRSDEEQRTLLDYYSAHSQPTKRLRTDIANLKERLAVLTDEFQTMVMDVAEKPRETFILHRGDYSQPTTKVEPGTPHSLPTLATTPTRSASEGNAPPTAIDAPPQSAIRNPQSEISPPSDRLALARWLVMRENPLTARVAVNRIWQMLFGVGLVKTAADFGTQGEYPSHPELLDYLAIEFQDSGWNVKALIKKIVLSVTYQQTSNAEFGMRNAESETSKNTATPHSALRTPHLTDPENRLLWRGPRFRLPAELIRDSALKVSGLLVHRIGGPSVNPYTPGDPWREISHYGSTPATSQTFVQDHGEKLYRRSLYTYWKRTAPPPNMVVFDAPNRETCVVNRASTTTPLQALTLLNDPQFVEAARAFAQRILALDSVSAERKSPGDSTTNPQSEIRNPQSNDTARLTQAFTTATSRPPTDQELAVLEKTLHRERTRYQKNPNLAIAFLATGESPRNEKIPPAEHAAWSQIALMLLNLSESITRN